MEPSCFNIIKVKSFSMQPLAPLSSSPTSSSSHSIISQTQRMHIMTTSPLHFTSPSRAIPIISPHTLSYPKFHSFSQKPPSLNLCVHSSPMRLLKFSPHVGGVEEAVGSAIRLVQSSPATWQSAFASNVLIFLLGSPVLASGLTLSGVVSAFVLGTLTWRAFGSSGFLLVAAYFILGTAVTKVKMAQKEAQGIAEKRKGRRGPGSVIGSSAAGCLCALLSIYGFGGDAFSQLWLLGFVASFCTKLSDTVSSEIGKAYGKTTYLVTTFKIVPRGTEGAVSVEGTLAGILGSIALAFLGCRLGKINAYEAAICVLASQIANLGESFIGAALQGKKGFQWLTNDVANVINISTGSVVAILLQLALQKLNM